MFDKKLQDNNGQAMVLVILVVALVSMFGIMAVNQIGNQIKSTTNRYENIQGKYIAEAGIERTIKEACEKLSKINTISLGLEFYLDNIKSNSLYINSNIANMKTALKDAEIELDKISSKISISSVICKINNIKNETDMMDMVMEVIGDIEEILKEAKEIKDEVEDNVDLAIKYLYKAFNYAQIEINKDVKELPLIDSPGHEDENAKLVDALITSETFNNIVRKTSDAYNMSSISSIIGWTSEYENIFSKGRDIYDYLYTNKDGKLCIHTKLNNYKELLYKNTLQSNEVEQLLNEIKENIDCVISLIVELQIDIMKIYVNNFNDAAELKKACNDAIKIYDGIKNDFIWLNKKLGLEDIVIGPETGTGGDIDGNDGSIIVTKLVLENYKNTFSDYINDIEYKYEIEYQNSESNIVKQIEKDIIVNKDNNGSITSINDIDVNIICSAYKINKLGNQKLYYKIKLKVVFKIDVKNNYKINYEIQSYDKVS